MGKTKSNQKLVVEYNKFITGFEQYTKSFLEAIENCWPLAIALLPSVNIPFINTAEKFCFMGYLGNILSTNM